MTDERADFVKPPASEEMFIGNGFLLGILSLCSLQIREPLSVMQDYPRNRILSRLMVWVASSRDFSLRPKSVGRSVTEESLQSGMLKIRHANRIA